jgi:ABC-type Co2+ transport system permease subunit
MDEKLKNQVLISVVAAGVVFMIWMFYRTLTTSGGLVFTYLIGFVLGIAVGGATFGILYLVQKE